MIYFLSIILGLIQALTEFLPISSSAHLILARAWLDFGFADGLTFDVALHLGTVGAIVFYYRKDIMTLGRAWLRSFGARDWSDPNQRLSWYIIAGCVPAAVVGATLATWIEIVFRNPAVIMVTLVLGGLLFIYVERRPERVGAMEEMNLRRAILIGAAQTLALIPGVSRSGITIAVGMMNGFKRKEAARFSFLMGAPLLAGAGAVKMLDLVGQPVTQTEIGVMLIGAATAAIAGWIVIRILMSILDRFGLAVFAWYRFALALGVGAFLWLK